MTNKIETTSLQEAQEVCGVNLNSSEIFSSAEAIFYADASSSVARLNAWESFSAARATNFFETKIVSTPFPCGTVESCMPNTPYNLASTFQASEANEIGLVQSTATEAFVRIFGDPKEILEAKFKGAKARAIKSGKTEEEAIAIATEKTFQLGKNFPVTLFGDKNGNTFPSISIRDNQFMVQAIGQTLFPNRSGEFVVHSLLEQLAKRNLAQVRKIFAEQTGLSDAVALKCVCLECSYSGAIVEHVVGYSGEVASKYGAFQTGAKAKPKCSIMKPLVNGEIDLNSFSFKQLIEAGFVPQGKCLYLLEGMVCYSPKKVLAIRDYSSARGTVKAAAQMWKGQVIVTPRGYIKMGDRNANAYELIDFMRNGGSDLVKQFSDCIPQFGDGKSYTLNLQTQSIQIET